MAITSGYNRTDGLEELRKSVNSKLNSIHPDENFNPPGCENPSTRMQKYIHPDEKGAQERRYITRPVSLDGLA